MNRIVATLLLLGSGLLGCSGTAPQPADLVLLNGKIVTVDEEQTQVEALAARDGLIVAIGSTAEIERYRGAATEVIDLEGKLALPGFIEGHGHFAGLGTALMSVDLTGARSWEEVIQRVSAAADDSEPGEWVTGRGWHQEKWDAPPRPAVEGYPVHAALSAATPRNPVLLTHASGHASIANASALQAAGIDRSTRDPEGGTILRDADGRATGVLRETAQGLVRRAYAASEQALDAAAREARERRAIELADHECLSKGVTSFQDAGSQFETVDRLKAMYDEERIGVRLWVMLRESNDRLRERIADYRMIGAADGRLTVRALKRSIDGALGSHGAWLLEPYTDLPETSGLNTAGLDELEELADIAIEHGYQLCVHAIGDRGNRETLDLFERAFKRVGDEAERRWRVEHAQHLSPDDIPRFAELGVIASMQGVHCTSDGPWVPARLGRRRAAEGAYVWRKLLDSGAIVTNGTDTPVEDVDPIAGFHATVTRRMANGEQFYPQQAMTRTEALRSYTINAAYAAFEEQIKGSLEPGKMADVVVLSRDILSVPEDEILDTEVLYTIVGGRVLYRGESS